jgi:hypothetical protein
VEVELEHGSAVHLAEEAAECLTRVKGGYADVSAHFQVQLESYN